MQRPEARRHSGLLDTHQAGAIMPNGQPRWQRVAAGMWKPVLNIIGILCRIAVFPPAQYQVSDYV